MFGDEGGNFIPNYAPAPVRSFDIQNSMEYVCALDRTVSKIKFGFSAALIYSWCIFWGASDFRAFCFRNKYDNSGDENKIWNFDDVIRAVWPMLIKYHQTTSEQNNGVGWKQFQRLHAHQVCNCVAPPWWWPLMRKSPSRLLMAIMLHKYIVRLRSNVVVFGIVRVATVAAMAISIAPPFVLRPTNKCHQQHLNI